jgi:hypothetical protein
MPDQYSGDKSPEQRLKDRLRNSGSDPQWPATGLLETNPTRTITNIHRASMQQNATVSGQPRGSNPRDVGVGGFFTSDNDAWQKDYGEPKAGLRLSGSLFRPKR